MSLPCQSRSCKERRRFRVAIRHLLVVSEGATEIAPVTALFGRAALKTAESMLSDENAASAGRSFRGPSSNLRWRGKPRPASDLSLRVQ